MKSRKQSRWQVQVRKNRAHKWVNKGLFETRAMARWRANDMRSGHYDGSKMEMRDGYGFGNTRVRKYQRVGK